jgi:hypothetical protein
MEKQAPESDLDCCTVEKLKEKFEDVERNLQDAARKFSPLGHSAILLYRKALNKLINTELNERTNWNGCH